MTTTLRALLLALALALVPALALGQSGVGPWTPSQPGGGSSSGVATALKSATTDVDVSAATAPSSGQILTATGGTAATWQAPAAATTLKSATTEVGVSAATAPSAGQVLTATSGTAATWQAATATGLKSATTTVSISAATAPTAGQVLTASSDSLATWTTPASSAWTDGACTRINDSSFSVTDNAANVAIYRAGVPMRYGDTVGTWYRGLITAVVDSGATLTVSITGAPMDAAHDAYCQYGMANLLVRDLWTIPGQVADGANTTLMLTDDLFIVPPSYSTTRYLLLFCVRPITDDTGANQPATSFYVNGSAVSTALTVSDAAWTCTSPATLDATKYDMLNGETWEVGTDAAGSNDDSTNYSYVAWWLYEM